MNNITHNTALIPEAILELLPWFVLGKLSSDDQASYEKALKTYPSLQKQFELEQRMIALVSADNTLLDKSAIAPAEERLKSVFNVIDNLDTTVASNAKLSIVAKLKNVFNSIIPSLGIKPQYARFAGVAALALSVAILSAIVIPSSTETSDYSLASADAPSLVNQTPVANAAKTILLVGFNGTEEELAQNDVLKGKQINIGSPEDNDGFFQISFNDSMSTDEVQQTMEALLAQKETVWFVGEAF